METGTQINGLAGTMAGRLAPFAPLRFCVFALRRFIRLEISAVSEVLNAKTQSRSGVMRVLDKIRCIFNGLEIRQAGHCERARNSTRPLGARAVPNGVPV